MRAISGSRGVARIVEVDIAASAPLIPQILARDGLCVAYGSSSPEVKLPFLPMILSGAAIRFFIVYELPAAARLNGIADLTRWLTAGRLVNAIATSVPLHSIAAAHEAVEGGRMVGNVTVRV